MTKKYTIKIKRIRKCDVCGMESTPGAIGNHQKVSGHVGWTDRVVDLNAFKPLPILPEVKDIPEEETVRDISAPDYKNDKVTVIMTNADYKLIEWIWLTELVGFISVIALLIGILFAI